MKKLILYLIIFVSFKSFGQDLNAKVQILSPQIFNTNKRPIEVLQIAIQNFLNNRKWSAQDIKPQERIDCNLVINIKEWDGSSNYKGEAQIISSRPVFGSTYNTPILSISDKDFNFSYSEGEPLEYSDQNLINNLTSILAFYAYVIVGLDEDSFINLGGNISFSKAQDVVNNAQNAPFSGWKAFEGLKNRYWLSENLNNKAFLPLRNLLYTYHREGLDIMSENLTKARKNIASSLPLLAELDIQKQGSLLNQVFFSAKGEEITNIFSKSDPMERIKIYNILAEADPGNATKYEVLKTGN